MSALTYLAQDRQTDSEWSLVLEIYGRTRSKTGLTMPNPQICLCLGLVDTMITAPVAT